MRIPRLLVTLLAAACLSAQAASDSEGVIRIWGHGARDADFIGPLVASWESGVRKLHPDIRFEASLLGDKSAIGGLYTGAADVAIMERGLSAIEKDSYEQVFGRTDPFEVTVATGSLDVRNHAPALVIFVHKDNPLDKVTLKQLDAIFGADHRRGDRNIRTWGELGIAGEWAGKPINSYGFPIPDDASQFFQKAVMSGSQKWTGNLTELTAAKSGGKSVDAGQRILDALAKDRYGIAISHLQYRNAQVKPLALAIDEAGPYYEATRQTLIERRYPLARSVSVYINREPGKPVEARLKEFLRYVLGTRGQGDIARDGGYLPLTPAAAREEWRKVE
jgi:phosphate transport system substrate-binding protein